MFPLTECFTISALHASPSAVTHVHSALATQGNAPLACGNSEEHRARMTQIPCGNSEELRYGSLWGPDSPAATLPQAHTYTFAMTAMALLHRDPTHVATPWDLGVLDAFCAALVRACSQLPPPDRVAPSLLQHLVHCLSTLAPRAAASTSPHAYFMLVSNTQHGDQI